MMKRLGGCADLMECSGVTPQSGTFIGNCFVIAEENLNPVYYYRNLN
jgi:hypothetical protein